MNSNDPIQPAPAEFQRPTSPGDLTPYLKVLLAGQTLNAERTAAAFEAIMSGQAHEAEIGALLALLATRTPTADELLGAARVMRAHVDRVESKIDPAQLVDTAGTGGAPKTFNVSPVSGRCPAGPRTILAVSFLWWAGWASAAQLRSLEVGYEDGRYRVEAELVIEAAVASANDRFPARTDVIGEPNPWSPVIAVVL